MKNDCLPNSLLILQPSEAMKFIVFYFLIGYIVCQTSRYTFFFVTRAFVEIIIYDNRLDLYMTLYVLVYIRFVMFNK